MRMEYRHRHHPRKGSELILDVLHHLLQGTIWRVQRRHLQPDRRVHWWAVWWLLLQVQCLLHQGQCLLRQAQCLHRQK